MTQIQNNTYEVVYSDGKRILDYIIASNLTEAKKIAKEKYDSDLLQKQITLIREIMDLNYEKIKIQERRINVLRKELNI